ncbi:MAG: hypothetical protein V4797_19595 [Paraburkholderia tropica]|uniref:hypothetical protein n=1 Tax=Paraburkholderia tropica TaxID=92647 RepID=UPI003100F147
MKKRTSWPMRLEEGATGIGTSTISDGEPRTWSAPEKVSKPAAAGDAAKKAMQALGRLKVGVMNQTEQRYAQHLEARKQAGEIEWYVFEGWKFRLADNTFYTPDFAVMLADCRLECHEVKGHWQDDARAKIKVAAYQHPVKFIAVTAKSKKAGGGWQVEEF